jgi:hypothetical protein
MTAAEANDPAQQMLALIRCLEFQGVIVRRCPTDKDFYGVQINRYLPEDDEGKTGTQAMLFGPVTAAELVPLLLEANELATANDGAFTHYRVGPRGVSLPVPDRGKENGGGMIRLHLWTCYDLAPELGEHPGPALSVFAESLRDSLTPAERTAMAAVLNGTAGDLDIHHSALLAQPVELSTSIGSPNRVYRHEPKKVLWA